MDRFEIVIAELLPVVAVWLPALRVLILGRHLTAAQAALALHDLGLDVEMAHGDGRRPVAQDH